LENEDEVDEVNEDETEEESHDDEDENESEDTSESGDSDSDQSEDQRDADDAAETEEEGKDTSSDDDGGADNDEGVDSDTSEGAGGESEPVLTLDETVGDVATLLKEGKFKEARSTLISVVATIDSDTPAETDSSFNFGVERKKHADESLFRVPSDPTTEKEDDIDTRSNEEDKPDEKDLPAGVIVGTFRDSNGMIGQIITKKGETEEEAEKRVLSGGTNREVVDSTPGIRSDLKGKENPYERHRF